MTAILLQIHIVTTFIKKNELGMITIKEIEENWKININIYLTCNGLSFCSYQMSNREIATTNKIIFRNTLVFNSNNLF